MSAEKETDIPLRLPGLMERFNIVRNHVKFYNNVQVSATYTVPRNALQSLDLQGFTALIYSTIRETLKSQPILNVVIEDEETPQPKWKRVETIDLQELVKFTEHDPGSSPDTWLTEGHVERLDRVNELPAWRIRVGVLESDLTASKTPTVTFILAFYGHHAIADGVSCGAFHTSFLSNLTHLISNPSSITTSPFIRPSPTLQLLPSLEEATPLPITLFFLLKNVIKVFIYNPPDRLNWSGPLIPSSLPTITPNLRTFSLHPTELASLITRCRNHRTTLTSLISVLTARKIAAMHPTHSHFSAIVPFSFRKFSGHNARAMGVYVSSLVPYFASETPTPRGYISCANTPARKPEDGNEDLWESARQVKETLVAGSASPSNQMVGMLKYAGDLKSFFLGMWGKNRDHAFEVSNIGVVDGGIITKTDDAGNQGERKEKGRVWFDKMVFSSGLCVYGNTFSILVVSAKGGHLTVSVGWMSEVTVEREAVELCGYLEEWMKGLARENAS